MNFSSIVKATMKQKKMSYAELARLTGYSSQYISDLVSGERRWNEDTINKVCTALDISIKYEKDEDLKI